MIAVRDAIKLVECYGLEVSVPSELYRAHKPPRGYVTVSESFLKFRIRFSLNQFFKDVLQYYKITVFLVTPNGWAHMIGLYVLFVERKMSPLTVEELSWFYTLKANKGDQGFYYFVKRTTKGLQAITKIRESLGN